MIHLSAEAQDPSREYSDFCNCLFGPGRKSLTGELAGKEDVSKAKEKASKIGAKNVSHALAPGVLNSLASPTQIIRLFIPWNSNNMLLSIRYIITNIDPI